MAAGFVFLVVYYAILADPHACIVLGGEVADVSHHAVLPESKSMRTVYQTPGQSILMTPRAASDPTSLFVLPR